jgi:hypothetical protein
VAGLRGLEKGSYRIELSGATEVEWRVSGDHPWGVSGGRKIGSGRFYWNRGHGEFACRLEPAQPVYGPGEVLTGVTRPEGQTNVWFSDPDQPMPQWLDLEWDRPVDIRSVEVTFPGQLAHEVHWENPFYIAPHIAETYCLEVENEEGWRTVHRETGNWRSRRVHDLGPPIRTRRLRVLVERTHGARSAGLSEVRCYG